MLREEEDINNAKKAFETALDIASVTLRQKGFIDYYKDMAVAAFNLGEIFCMEEDFISGRKYFKIAVENDEYVYNKTQNEADFIRLGVSLYYLNEVSDDKEVTKKAYEIFNEICKNHPDVSDYKNVKEYLEKSFY